MKIIRGTPYNVVTRDYYSLLMLDGPLFHMSGVFRVIIAAYMAPGLLCLY